MHKRELQVTKHRLMSDGFPFSTFTCLSASLALYFFPFPPRQPSSQTYSGRIIQLVKFHSSIHNMDEKKKVEEEVKWKDGLGIVR